MKNFKWRPRGKMRAAQKKWRPLRKKWRPLRKKWRLRRIKCGPRRNVPGPGTKKCGPLRKIPGPGTKKCGPLMKKCGPLMKKCGPPGSSLWHCSKCRCRKCRVLAFARACSPLSPMPQQLRPQEKARLLKPQHFCAPCRWFFARMPAFGASLPAPCAGVRP